MAFFELMTFILNHFACLSVFFLTEGNTLKMTCTLYIWCIKIEYGVVCKHVKHTSQYHINKYFSTVSNSHLSRLMEIHCEFEM